MHVYNYCKIAVGGLYLSNFLQGCCFCSLYSVIWINYHTFLQKVLYYIHIQCTTTGQYILYSNIPYIALPPGKYLDIAWE